MAGEIVRMQVELGPQACQVMSTDIMQDLAAAVTTNFVKTNTDVVYACIVQNPVLERVGIEGSEGGIVSWAALVVR